MTPPPAATVTGGRTIRPAAARPSRTPARRPGGILRSLPRPVIGRPSLAAVRSAAIERLFAGRTWIVVLGTMLLGLVFLQVTLLQLNTRISTDIQSAAALERDNAELRSGISHLAAGRRVQDVARQLGMILPGAGAMCYLRAAHSGPCDGGRQLGSTAQAADNAIVATPPLPGSAAATGTIPTTTATQPASTTPAAATTTAPAPAGTAPAAPGTAQAPPVTAQQPALVQQTSVQQQPAVSAATAPAPAGGQVAPAP